MAFKALNVKTISGISLMLFLCSEPFDFMSQQLNSSNIELPDELINYIEVIIGIHEECFSSEGGDSDDTS